MCAGFNPDWSYIDYVLKIIFTYQVGSMATYVDNSINFTGNADVPPIEYEGSSEGVDAAERQLIQCLVSLRADRFKAALNNVHDIGQTIRVFQGQCPTGARGCISMGSVNQDITMDREKIMETVASYSSTDSVTQEQMLYLKGYADVFIHEVCHTYVPGGHPGYGEGSPKDEAYFQTDFGKCERFGYLYTVGESSPDYRVTVGVNQSYSWPRACLANIWNDPDNSDFFQSVKSATAAQTQVPYPIRWEVGPNPH